MVKMWAFIEELSKGHEYTIAALGVIGTLFAVGTSICIANISKRIAKEQAKRDIFFRNAETITDELYALTVEIAYWWTHIAWENYAIEYINEVRLNPNITEPKYRRPAHQNKITLAIHTRNALKAGHKATIGQILILLKRDGKINAINSDAEEKNGEINIIKDRYVSQFKKLMNEAKNIDSKVVDTYQNSPLGELNAALEKIPN